MADRIDGFSPDVGLENVASLSEQRLKMPSQAYAHSQLTGQPIPQQVDALFPGNSIEGVMEDFVSPKVTDPAILMPIRFDALIRQATSEIRTQAEKSDDQALHAASDILDEHMDLRDLLHRNQAALHQV